jgi:hypothetical protein
VIDVRWDFNVVHDSHKGNSLYYETIRGIEYLIIGKLGWSRPIENISVTFDIRNPGYFSYKEKTNGIKQIEKNDEHVMLEYKVQNFSKERQLLEVLFKKESRFQPGTYVYIQCCSGLGTMLFIVFIVFLIKWSIGRSKKENAPIINSSGIVITCPWCDRWVRKESNDRLKGRHDRENVECPHCKRWIEFDLDGKPSKRMEKDYIAEQVEGQ